MKKVDYTDLIENYLNGILTKSEIFDFEQQLNKNIILNNEYNLQKEIRQVLTDIEIIELHEKLIKLKSKQPIKKKYRIVKYIPYAACVFGIIFVLFYFFWNNALSNSEIYNKYYKHISINSQIRGIDDTPNNVIDLYESGKYSEVVKMANQITDSSEYYTVYEYIFGLSYVELQDFDQAIIHFSNAEKDIQHLYSLEATWQMGLCYLKSNNSKKAIYQFEKLVKEHTYYKNEAQEILNLMGN